MSSWNGNWVWRPEGRRVGLPARVGALALLVALISGRWSAADTVVTRPGGPLTYSGCCDASGAAPVNDLLLAAASDEDNVLRLYRTAGGGAPVGTVPLAAALGTRRGDEADFEGAARVGDWIFWVGSHSRNKDGEARPARHVLLATAISGQGAAATLKPVGRVFRDLVTTLAAVPAVQSFRLVEAAGRSGEDPGGLNIEGIAATPEDGLLIGFRSPVPGGRALLVPLLNPRGVVGTEAPRWGEPLLVDLGGLGIRDLTWTGTEYLVIGGSAEGGGRHRLFRWLPGAAPAEVAAPWSKGFRAESVVSEGPGRALVLGDEDSEKVQGKRCEDWQDRSQRSFRAFRVNY